MQRLKEAVDVAVPNAKVTMGRLMVSTSLGLDTALRSSAYYVKMRGGVSKYRPQAALRHIGLSWAGSVLAIAAVAGESYFDIMRKLTSIIPSWGWSIWISEILTRGSVSTLSHISLWTGRCGMALAQAADPYRFVVPYPLVKTPQIARRSSACFAHIIEGDVERPGRQRCEAALFANLDAMGIKLDLVAVNEAGCSFVVNEADAARLRAATRPLNVALRLNMGCACIALSASEADSSFPTTAQIIAAMGKDNIDVIHLTRDSAILAVIVAEQDAPRAADLLAGPWLSGSVAKAERDT